MDIKPEAEAASSCCVVSTNLIQTDMCSSTHDDISEKVIVYASTISLNKYLVIIFHIGKKFIIRLTTAARLHLFTVFNNNNNFYLPLCVYNKCFT